MVSDTHATAIHTLASSYRTLPWYKKLFFPRKIALALAALPALSNDYTVENTRQFVIAYLNTSSFFSTFFNCLNQFLRTPFMQAVMAHNHGGFIEQTVFMNIVFPDKATFLSAATDGRLDELRTLCANKTRAVIQEMLSDNEFAPFRLAAANGHRLILEYLEPFISPEVLEYSCYAGFLTAAEKGHLHMLQ